MGTLVRMNFQFPLLRTQFLRKSNRNYSDTAVGDKYEKFFDMVKRRKAEAQASVVVQVNSENSKNELFNYCSTFGAIKNMFHYKHASKNFIIVEFNSKKTVGDVIASGCFARTDELPPTPIPSPFLWFRAVRDKPKLGLGTDVELRIKDGTTITSQQTLLSKLAACKNMAGQIDTLHELTRLSETGTRLRFISSHQIEMALYGMFPNNAVYPFGSSVNGFGKEGCDLDLLVDFDTQLNTSDNGRLVFHSKFGFANERSQNQRYMECLADMLNVFMTGCVNIRRILQARVPIIKYHHEFADLECDLSLGNLSGVYMSDLLYTISSIDKRVQPLVFSIRTWAKSCGLTSSSPGPWITNFGLTLMVLFFLQNCQIIPSINTLMKLADVNNDPKMVLDGINCSFAHDFIKLKKSGINPKTVDQLLVEFFEFYAAFDFTNRAISLNEAKDLLKPEHCALYIVNPLERRYNVTKNVSVDELERLKLEIRNASWILDSDNSTGTKPGILSILQSNERYSKHPFITMAKQLTAENVKNKRRGSRLVNVNNLFTDQDDTSNPVTSVKERVKIQDR